MISESLTGLEDEMQTVFKKISEEQCDIQKIATMDEAREMTAKF